MAQGSQGVPAESRQSTLRVQQLKRRQPLPQLATRYENNSFTRSFRVLRLISASPFHRGPILLWRPSIPPLASIQIPASNINSSSSTDNNSNNNNKSFQISLAKEYRLSFRCASTQLATHSCLSDMFSREQMSSGLMVSLPRLPQSSTRS